MNCEQLDEYLLDFVEARLDAPQAEQVRAHVQACASCRVAVQDTRELLGVMEDVRARQEDVWGDRTISQRRGSPVPRRLDVRRLRLAQGLETRAAEARRCGRGRYSLKVAPFATPRQRQPVKG